MFISELINDGNIGFEQFSLFVDGRLNKKIKAKVTDTALQDAVFLTVHIRIVRSYHCMSQGFRFSKFGTHNNYIVL